MYYYGEYDVNVTDGNYGSYCNNNNKKTTYYKLQLPFNTAACQQ